MRVGSGTNIRGWLLAAILPHVLHAGATLAHAATLPAASPPAAFSEDGVMRPSPAPAAAVTPGARNPDTTGAAPAEEFPARLASFTTTLIGSSPARTANIRVAVEALDGTVVEPGEVLSFNAVVGPRTVERGYQMAPVILHEERQIQTGGGVCQVASTLFAAALLSGLASVERWRHSFAVDYIAVGEDATIAWGAKDLRVRNDTGQRARLRLALTGVALTARFEAEEAGPESFELVTETRELPPEPGLGDAAPGREIDLFRVRYEAGAEVDRQFIHRDTYPPTRGRRPETP